MAILTAPKASVLYLNRTRNTEEGSCLELDDHPKDVVLSNHIIHTRSTDVWFSRGKLSA